MARHRAGYFTPIMNKASLIASAMLAALPTQMPAGVLPDFSRISVRRPSKSYPEQSSRQAMRGHRRAQGGPGIELNRRTHEYQPRYF